MQPRHRPRYAWTYRREARAGRAVAARPRPAHTGLLRPAKVVLNRAAGGRPLPHCFFRTLAVRVVNRPCRFPNLHPVDYNSRSAPIIAARTENPLCWRQFAVSHMLEERRRQ
jgi:hypothetical protein